MSEPIDLGNGYSTPAELRIVLNDDGTIALHNHGAVTTWCFKHGKELCVTLTDVSAGNPGGVNVSQSEPCPFGNFADYAAVFPWRDPTPEDTIRDAMSDCLARKMQAEIEAAMGVDKAHSPANIVEWHIGMSAQEPTPADRPPDEPKPIKFREFL